MSSIGLACSKHSKTTACHATQTPQQNTQVNDGDKSMADSFSISEEYVEAEVYKETESSGVKVFLVKIKFLEIQTYISGIRVQKSPKRPEDGLWVQMPAVKIGFQYKKIIECAGGSPFLEIVERKAIQAVEDYIGGTDAPFPTISVTADTAFDEALKSFTKQDIDDIPF